MKRRSRTRMSLGKNTDNDSDKGLVDMQSILFNSTVRSTSESVVVPETPNNSYHCMPTDADTTTGTVLETPDTPVSALTKSSVNMSRKNCTDFSEKTFEALLSRNAVELNEKCNDFMYGDSPPLDITPDLKFVRRKKVSSILESEHSFAQSLQSQDLRNSSMVTEEREYNFIKSPLKRRWRRSLANVILPFDLNDEGVLKTKLQTIKENDKASKAREVAQSPGISRVQTNEKSKGRSSRVSHQFSDLDLHDVTPVKRSRLGSNRNKSSKKTSNKENNSTVIFENDDLDLTAVGNVNENLSNMIKDMEAKSFLEGEKAHGVDSDESVMQCKSLASAQKEKEHDITLPLLQKDDHEDSLVLRLDGQCKKLVPVTQAKDNVKDLTLQRNNGKESVFLGEEVPFHRNKGTTASTSDSNDSIMNSSSCSDYLPTQPASILILQDVVAYVEVRVGSANWSEVIKDQLRELGACVKEKLTTDVTHIIFKDGSKTTFDRAKKRGLHIVSSLWVDACKEKFARVPETLYPSGSLETYTNPILPNKLRKLKSMQPKDFQEEERLASVRAQRRKRMLKSAVLSASSEDLEKYATPKRNSTANDDVSSPLFGIGHLLTPNSRNRLYLSSPEGGSADGGSSLEDTFATPLSKRLYDRFIVPQNLRSGQKDKQSKNTSEIRTDSSCLDLTTTSCSSKNEGLSKDVSKLSETVSNEKLLIEKSPESTEARNNATTLPVPLFSASLTETVADENSVNQQAISHQLKPRRSQRLSQVFSIHKQSSAYSSSNGFVKNGVDKSVASNITQNSKRVTNSSSSDDGLQDSSQGDSKRKPAIHQVKRVLKEKKNVAEKKMIKGIVMEKGYKSKSTLTSSIPAQSSKSVSQSSHCSISDSYSTVWEDSTCSNSSLKCRHKLMPTEHTQPSEELIAPSTPIKGRFPSLGPYADLLVQNKNSRGGKFRSSSRKENRKKVSKTSKNSSEQSGDSSLSSAGSLDNVFFSLDEEQTPLQSKISPIPRNRKSVEEFVIRRPSRGSRRFSQRKSICLTSFHTGEKKYIVPIIKKLGGYDITCYIDSHTTHVLCGAERRTLNVLLGIAQGIWIVDKSWVLESLEMGIWAPEEPFELFNYCPGAKICRKQRETQGSSYKQTLFSGVGSIYVMEGCQPSSDQLTDLLMLCGCHLVSSVRNANVVVCNPAQFYRTSNRIGHITYVSEKWILDSIQHHKIQNLSDYIIGNDNRATSS